MLPRGRSAAYNQAIMDFGATVCTPRRPRCGGCAFRQNCSALHAGAVDALPVKAKRPKRRRRYLDYLHVVRADGAVLLGRRGGGDIWQGLYDLPVAEATAAGTEVSAANAAALLATVLPELAGAAVFEAATAPARTQLTHQELVMRYWRYAVDGPADDPPAGAGRRWVGPAELATLGTPQPLARYLGDAQMGLAL